MSTAGRAAEVCYAVTRQLKVAAALGAGRDLHADWTVNRGNIDFGAQGSLYHANFFLAEYQIALAGELFVRLNSNVHIKVATFASANGVTLPSQANSSAIVDTGRHFNFEVAVFGLGAIATTNCTYLFGDFASALALGTDTSLLNIAKNGSGQPSYLARALALRASYHLVAWLNSRALTM